MGRAAGVSVSQCAQRHRDSTAANAELGSCNSYFYFLYAVVSLSWHLILEINERVRKGPFPSPPPLCKHYNLQGGTGAVL